MPILQMKKLKLGDTKQLSEFIKLRSEEAQIQTKAVLAP